MVADLDGEQKDLDAKPGTLIRVLMESWFDDWKEYESVYIKRNPTDKHSIFRYYVLHNEYGPAAIRTSGEMEWWLYGEKVFITTQQEFECYMRNKAFW